LTGTTSTSKLMPKQPKRCRTRTYPNGCNALVIRRTNKTTTEQTLTTWISVKSTSKTGNSRNL